MFGIFGGSAKYEKGYLDNPGDYFHVFEHDIFSNKFIHFQEGIFLYTATGGGWNSDVPIYKSDVMAKCDKF